MYPLWAYETRTHRRPLDGPQQWTDVQQTSVDSKYFVTIGKILHAVCTDRCQNDCVLLTADILSCFILCASLRHKSPFHYKR